jgi:hypothetical protein
MTEKIIYNLLMIILPTAFVLFNIANVVFTIGEFKEEISRVPKFLIYILIKNAFIELLLLHSFHYIFVNDVLKNYVYISFMISAYIVVESVISFKMLKNYRKTLKEGKTEGKLLILILENSKKLLSRNKFSFYLTKFFEFLLLITVVINCITTASKFNYSLVLVMMLIIISSEFIFYKFKNKLWNRH